MFRLLKCPHQSSPMITWFAKTIFVFSIILLLGYQLFNFRVLNDTESLFDKTKIARGSMVALDNMDDFICNDRYGEPIRRQEARLVKNHKSKTNSFLTIGIPTIERNFRGKKQSYLTTTLKSLFDKLSENDKKEITVVVFCGDEVPQKRDLILKRLVKEFPGYIENGTIDVIYAPQRFYSQLENLPLTYNNSKVRVRWRGKQCLDYAFMMYYASGLSDFYLHLEDDIKSQDGFYQLIKEDASKRSRNERKWIIRRYYSMGFIGKLIASEYIRLLADYWRLFYYQKPLDWLYFDFLGMVNGMEPEKSGRRFLFHHIGEQSSSKNNE